MLFPIGVTAALFVTMGLWSEIHGRVVVTGISYALGMPILMIVLWCQRTKRYGDTPQHRRSVGVAVLVALMGLVGLVITLGTLYLLVIAWGFSSMD
ncbi:MAG: hypothetical protein ACI89L_000531 [Phycisphaerales bacterium]